jgi:hypothetical protein
MDKKLSYFKKLSSTMKFIVTGLIYATTALIVIPSLAANEPPEIPWYEVEVIIVANKQKLGVDTETWPQMVQTAGYDRIYDLALPGFTPLKAKLPPVNAEAANRSLQPASLDSGDDNLYANGAYVLLEKDFLQLNSMARRLRASPNYDVVLHIGWRQPTFDEDKAKPVFVFNGMLNPDPVPKPPSNPGSDPQQYGFYVDGIKTGPQYYWLSGTLKLSVSRYLHFETDLHMKLRTTRQEVIEQSPAPEDSGGFGSFFGMSKEPTPITIERPVLQDYRFYESRRMRSKEIHYFDNPLMGVIVKVTPYEPEPPAPEPVAPQPQPLKPTKATR